MPTATFRGAVAGALDRRHGAWGAYGQRAEQQEPGPDPDPVLDTTPGDPPGAGTGTMSGARDVPELPAELTLALTADLAALTIALDDPDVDLEAGVRALGDSVRGTVDSVLGVSLTVVVDGYPFTVTALAAGVISGPPSHGAVTPRPPGSGRRGGCRAFNDRDVREYRGAAGG